MTITEMHVWFRQYAQQMGMQNVRAILPEQIDLLINTSIMDAVNQVITQNIGVTNDRVITDNSKIGQINALKSLYKVIEVNAIATPSYIVPKGIFKVGDESSLMRIYANIEELDPTIEGGFKPLFLVDFAMKYSNAFNPPETPNFVTKYFPVRLIDDAFLADTLNDFILGPRLRTPIAVIYNNQIDIYIDNLVNNKLPENLYPYRLRVSYIAAPAKVKYAADINGKNEDCDLPAHMHVDILKHAVDLYRIAITGSLQSAQAQQQVQQQEDVRNNASPNARQ